jgi:hypothetical protein
VLRQHSKVNLIFGSSCCSIEKMMTRESQTTHTRQTTTTKTAKDLCLSPAGAEARRERNSGWRQGSSHIAFTNVSSLFRTSFEWIAGASK